MDGALTAGVTTSCSPAGGGPGLLEWLWAWLGTFVIFRGPLCGYPSAKFPWRGGLVPL
jgi:hypothetical protein